MTTTAPGTDRTAASVIDEALTPATRRVAYGLILTVAAIGLGVSGLPAPLYGLYESRWHLSPLTTTIVFAVYAVAALAAILVVGKVSDVVGRKPVLLVAGVGLIVGLIIFMTAQDVTMLLVARAIHGLSVGSIVVASAAALLDLRPGHGARSGQLTGVMFNVGMAVAISGSAVLAQYVSNPLLTPYAVVSVICLLALIGVALLDETHLERERTKIRIAKPSVPVAIRGDFWFAALGVMASWSVLGVLLSLYPTLASTSTHIHNLAFGGAVVATTAATAAVAQFFGSALRPRTSAIVGDVGMAIALALSIPAINSHQWGWIVAAAVLLGGTFGLGFGGSIRHLSDVVPESARGETMSAYYLLAYTAMAVPTILAGWAATEWGLEAIFPWFAGVTALACLFAAALGARRR